MRRKVPEALEDAENGLSDTFRQFLQQSYEHFKALDEQLTWYDTKVKQHAKHSDACQRLQTIPGYGPIISTAYANYVGNGTMFGKGRDVSASLGLVPRQKSSGGKNILLGISKRGDTYLRSLLVHGARAVVKQAKHKTDPLSQWINALCQRRGVNKAVVAYANKMARMGWVVLSRQDVYQSQACQH